MIKIQYISTAALKLNRRNPRKNAAAVDTVAKSIQAYGFKSPIIAGEDLTVWCGNSRLKAARKLGLTEVPVIVADDLTRKQLRELALIDNRSSEIADWDVDLLAEELAALDLSDFGLDWAPSSFEAGMTRGRDDVEEETEEYQKFLEKFEDKHTTDDCYTPPPVYEAVKLWAVEEYGWQDRPIARPFYPGGDYRKYKYTPECVVIDNPPFSIVSEIVRFYEEKGIDYFLFVPHLTCFSIPAASILAVGVKVIFENGADICTSFVASSGAKLRAVPELYRRVDAAAKEYAKNQTKTLPKYEYPPELMTAQRLHFLSKNGQSISISSARSVSKLDSQKKEGKSIFGYGFLISEASAEECREKYEQARLEQAKKEQARLEQGSTVWELSDRERRIVEELGREEEEKGGMPVER